MELGIAAFLLGLKSHHGGNVLRMSSKIRKNLLPEKKLSYRRGTAPRAVNLSTAAYCAKNLICKCLQHVNELGSHSMSSKWRYSIGRVSLPTSGLKQRLCLAPFPRYYHVYIIFAVYTCDCLWPREIIQFQYETFKSLKVISIGATGHTVYDFLLVIYWNYCLCFVPFPRYYHLFTKNSSGDEIANVNFLTTISHTRRPTSKYRKRDKPTSFNKLDDR